MKRFRKEIELLNIDNELSILWEDIYKKRLLLTKNKKRSKICADAVIYSKCLKRFKELK